MPSYRAQVVIHAPPEKVFGWVADLAAHPSWSADPIEVVADGPDRYRSTATSKGKTITATLAVVERSAPARFVFDATDLTGTWRHTFTLTPSGSETRVEREIAGTLSGAQLLLYWLVLLPVKKPNARRALQRLKAQIEASAS